MRRGGWERLGCGEAPPRPAHESPHGAGARPWAAWSKGRCRLGARAAEAPQTPPPCTRRAAGGPKLVSLGWGRRGGPPRSPRGDVTVRLPPPRGATSGSGTLQSLPKSLDPRRTAARTPPAPGPVPARRTPAAAARSPRPPPLRGCPASWPRGSARRRLLRLLLHTPLLLQPQKLGPKFQPNGRLLLSPISAPESGARRVLFGNPVTLRPKPRGARARGLAPAPPAPRSPSSESWRPPPPPAGSERRLTPRSRADRQKKRRARGVPGRPAPSPPLPPFTNHSGGGPRLRRPNGGLCFFGDRLRIGRKSEGAGAGAAEAVSAALWADS